MSAQPKELWWCPLWKRGKGSIFNDKCPKDHEPPDVKFVPAEPVVAWWIRDTKYLITRRSAAIRFMELGRKVERLVSAGVEDAD